MENELKKCLMCKNALCRTCPAQTEIPEVIDLVRNGKFDEAGKKLFDNNPLSAITGEVCPNHLYCHGSCVLNHKGNALNFGKIERVISRRYLDTLLEQHANTNPNNSPNPQSSGKKKNVLIIGSGPAGLAVAYYLQKDGHQITIYEKESEFGGMLRYGIPHFRLEKALVDKTINVLKNFGIVFHANTSADLCDIEKYKKDFDIIILAIGACVPRMLDIDGVYHATYAIDYLKDPNNGSTHTDRDIIVIGAGNVAIDCALTAAHLGAKSVNLCYRRDEAAMKAYPEELALARSNGVVFNYHMVPQKITEKGVTFTRKESTEEQEIFMPADKVIIAIGQAASTPDTACGIECTNGLIQTTDYRTNIENVYALGDAVTGTSTIIKAVASAKSLAAHLSPSKN